MGDKPIRLLHFADAHIDIANYGRHDPEVGLPLRVVDFLKALDQIVDCAIEQQVDLVIFAGDAYKDRNPQPTFQREWGQRMMRLSAAGIPTLLLVGNHDVSPASGRAHTLHEYDTLSVPNIHVADRIDRLGPDKLGLPLQIITIPWVSRSQLMARQETAGKTREEVLQIIEDRVATIVEKLVAEADPDLPLILTAHASVHGAQYSSERRVMLGDELVLSNRVVKDKRLDYVALGHIHKHQSLNDRFHPPVIYPGSIERIDFGEAREAKGFVLATVEKGRADWEFMRLKTRRFIDLSVEPDSAESFMSDITDRLPAPEQVADAICRLRLLYSRDWEPLLDEAALHNHFSQALSFHIQKQIRSEQRARLGDTVAIESLTPEELLGIYWRSSGLDEAEADAMQVLAKEVFAGLS